ncbi:MAG: ABC transporter substrate-binding protein [Nitrospirae bacterium]|nr:ABC transporter substrate-binding protein [Nitrospirota bacterium]
MADMKRVILSLLLLAGWNEAALSSPPPPPQRIVSLAPALTETLFSIGLGDRIAGVTNDCDRPKEARRKPKIGGMANPSLEAIVSLKPDMVVMTNDGNPKVISDRLARLGIKTYIFKSRRLAEIPDGIREMGQALGAGPASEHLAGNIETALHDIALLPDGNNASEAVLGGGRKTLFVLWTSPLIVAGPGTIVDDAMKIAGLSNIASDAGVAYPRFSVETVIERQPDLILIGKMSDDMKTASKGFLASVNGLKAVKKGRICFMGDALYRPGPRIPEGMKELIRCGKMP